MKIRAGYDIAYELTHPTSIILMLTVHPSRHRDLRNEQRIAFSPSVTARDYLDYFGNVCTRILAPAGRLEIKTRLTVDDSGQPDVTATHAAQVDIDKLPSDALQFLLPSRYCDTEALCDVAWSLFGNSKPGWDRVQQICDYVHNHIAFGYQHARSDRTASDGHRERVGVCRDFAHLAVTLCRCMNIPARYCTGYLGDIGVPKDPAPMDFSAWFEVFLEGRWYTFDARHNVPRIGRILMARGRDAADVAISTSFGPARLARFDVVTEELHQRSPVTRFFAKDSPGSRQAVAG
jgi:transglutaminase-like putative cysteine protease